MPERKEICDAFKRKGCMFILSLPRSRLVLLISVLCIDKLPSAAVSGILILLACKMYAENPMAQDAHYHTLQGSNMGASGYSLIPQLDYQKQTLFAFSRLTQSMYFCLGLVIIVTGTSI